MILPTALLKRLAIFLHRWMGVALSLLFLLWFVSGIVMMYWSFPGVSPQDCLERSPVLNADTVTVSPAEAFKVLQWRDPPSAVRLQSFDGRPAYRFQYRSGEEIVYADDGTRQVGIPLQMSRRIAASWAGPQAGVATGMAVTQTDQWTVGGRLRTLRPLWKYSFADGSEVYVSGASGEVVQSTTSESRFWAYLGAIPHWLYFTPLRVHQKEWSNVVIWSSGIGAIASLLGIVVGIWMYSPAKRYRYAGQPASIPYHGQKRWHMIVGLSFGLTACTWAFSGMLSMDPFPAPGTVPEPAGLVRIRGALRGSGFQLAAFAKMHPRDALRSAGNFGVKELELATVAGEPMYVAASATGDMLFIPLEGAPFQDFGADRVTATLHRAADPMQLDIRMLAAYDAYYLDRHHKKPLPVLLVTEKGSESVRYYVDPKTSRVAGTYTSGRWMSRWLYHGLHSLDFPWLYNHRPLWDIVVITLLLGGTALCVTSLILTWQVLQRTIMGRSPPLGTLP